MRKYSLITAAGAKKAAQRQLEANLKGKLPPQGVRNIGYPGGNADHAVYSRGAGTLWYAPDRPHAGSPVPRFWNSFGVFNPDAKAQTIVVEANIPASANTGWVAGFFARDDASGDILLMHSGRVGGGRSGVGKTQFLAWNNPALVDVAIGENRYRSAIAIGSLNAADLTNRIWRFVEQVARFKSEAVSGRLDTADFRAAVAVYKKYSKGFSGRKTGTRRPNIDYESFHEDVVEEVERVRRSRLRTGEQIVITNLIDLGVRVGTDLVELYEIKTSCSRQSLYGALGQILTHAAQAPNSLKRFLVVPADEPVPPDIDVAIRKLGIEVRTFTRRPRGRDYRVTLN